MGNLGGKPQEEKKQHQKTQDLIDQYFSREFINHRIAIWNMREQVLSRKISVYFITEGFVYPIIRDYYDGNKVDGLSEHQHLTLYLGFIERLGWAIKNNQVIVEDIKNSLSYELLWSADLIRSVARAACILAENREKGMVPSIVKTVAIVLDTLKLKEENDEINESHFPNLSSESRFSKS